LVFSYNYNSIFLIICQFQGLLLLEIKEFTLSHQPAPFSKGAGLPNPLGNCPATLPTYALGISGRWHPPQRSVLPPPAFAGTSFRRALEPSIIASNGWLIERPRSAKSESRAWQTMVFSAFPSHTPSRCPRLHDVGTRN